MSPSKFRLYNVPRSSCAAPKSEAPLDEVDEVDKVDKPNKVDKVDDVERVDELAPDKVDELIDVNDDADREILMSCSDSSSYRATRMCRATISSLGTRVRSIIASRTGRCAANCGPTLPSQRAILGRGTFAHAFWHKPRVWNLLITMKSIAVVLPVHQVREEMLPNERLFQMLSKCTEVCWVTWTFSAFHAKQSFVKRVWIYCKPTVGEANQAQPIEYCTFRLVLLVHGHSMFSD